MSGRTTRQRSKPVILDLRKTDVGFEVMEPYAERYTNPIITPKPALPRPEKQLNYSKTMNPRSTDKGGVSPSSSAHMSDSLSRSKTMVRPPMPTSSKISIQNGMPMPERAAAGRPSDYAIKEEIYPFNSLPMTTGRLGPMAKNPLGNDLNISSHFEKPLGTTFGHHSTGIQLPEGIHHRPPVERTQKRYPVIIPSAAQWFEMEKIHQIEKDYMQEFFVGKSTKTPEIYKRYRNFIINLYRQNPANYLNSTTCRKHLAGDACAIMRLHSFLEHWGLINFHIDPAGYPKNLFLNRANCASETLFEFSNSDLNMDIIEQAVNGTLPSTENETLVRHIKTMHKSSGPVCDYCGLGCGAHWYLQKSQSQNQSGNPEQDPTQPSQQDNKTSKSSANDRRLVLCLDCFSEGNIPNVLTGKDFERVDLLRHLDSDTSRAQALGLWTQEETYKLLELIQKHGDNWTEIQKSFPFKSKRDLIACYLRMPLEKVTAMHIVEMGEVRGHEDNPDDRVADQVPTVFGDFSNPILQHAAVFRSLLTKHREQQRKKRQAILQSAQAAQAAAEEAKETKVEDRSDLEITRISDKAKEEEVSGVIQGTEEPVKVEGEEAEKDFELGEGEFTRKEEEMEEEKEVETVVKSTKGTLKEIANRLVELQVQKLDAKIDYLDEYEKILLHERKQQDVLQMGLLAEKVDVAHKRLEALKQMQPVPAQTAFPEQNMMQESSYFDFGTTGGNFGSYDMLDLGEGFPKDSF